MILYKKILFSIVIPVYNTERYLNDCVYSVISQTYDNWEIILVNDGSTDRSPMICDELASKFKGKVHVVHQENKGLLSARRAGMRIANGDVLLALDSDDMLRPDALASVASAFCEHNADMVIYGFSRRSDWSFIENDGILSTNGDISRLELVQKVCTSPTLNSMWAKAVRRSCLDIEADYSVYAGMSFAEDLLQSLPIIDKVQSAYYLHEALYFYRPNEGSLTHVFRQDYIEAEELAFARLWWYAFKWAEEFGDYSLIVGAATRTLDALACVAQSAAESLEKAKAADAMTRIAGLNIFSKAMAVPGSLDGLRFDRRFIAASINDGRYRFVIRLASIKRLLRRVREKFQGQ